MLHAMLQPMLYTMLCACIRFAMIPMIMIPMITIPMIPMITIPSACAETPSACAQTNSAFTVGKGGVTSQLIA